MNQNNIFNKYKNEEEFYSIVGIKMSTFEKMDDILKIAEIKQKANGGRKNKLAIEDRLLMALEY
jgi:hypothetical protein